MSIRSRRYVVSSVSMVSILALGGCETEPTAPDPDVMQVTMAAVGISTTVAPVFGYSGEVEYACPGGGTIALAGTFTAEIEEDHLVRVWDRTKRFDECSFDFEGTTVSTTGDLRLAGRAEYGPAVDHARPLLSEEAIQTGTLTTTYAGTERTCAYDLSIVFDSGNMEHRITGSICDRTIDIRDPFVGPGPAQDRGQ